MQGKVVRHGSGEDQRSSVGRESEARLGGAIVLGWILREVGGVHLGQVARPDRWKSDNNHGFRVAEGGRNVEAEVQRVLLFPGRQGEGGNVLVFSGMDGAEDARQVYHRSDVRAELAGAAEGR